MTAPPSFERRVQQVRDAFAAVGRGDVDAMLATYTDDAVQEFPYGTPPGVRVEGREAIRDRMTAALAVFRMELTITAAHQLADPDVMVVEFASRGHLEPSKVPYENTYVSIFGFREDQVAWVREYYDPIVSARALARDASLRESLDGTKT